MSTVEISDTWLGIQQQVKEDFLTYINKEEMVLLVKNFDLEVQGFSKKRINKAPKLLLKQTIARFLDNTTNLQSIFKGLVFHFINKMEDMDYNDFILNASLSNSLSNADKIILFATLYPEKYLDDRQRFCDNIDQEKDVFQGFIKPTLESLLKTLKEKYEDQLAKDVEEFFNIHAQFNGEIADTVELTEFFINDYEGLEEGLVLQLIRDVELDNSELSDKEKLFVYYLAVTESLYHAVKKFKEDHNKYQELMSQKELIETKFERIQKKYGTLNQQLKEKDEQITELINQQNNEMESLKEDNDRLTKEMNQMKQSYQQELAKREEIQVNVFDEDDQFLFLTTVETTTFEHVIPKQMIVHYSATTSFSDQFKFLPEQKLLFIDANEMTSKQQLKIQKYLIQKNYRYKFVSGSLEKMLRQIIFYLEGDFEYETNN